MMSGQQRDSSLPGNKNGNGSQIKSGVAAAVKVVKTERESEKNLTDIISTTNPEQSQGVSQSSKHNSVNANKSKKDSRIANLDNFRVTYADGSFPKGETEVTEQTIKSGKTAAQIAEENKTRTIGHYVVGKSINLPW